MAVKSILEIEVADAQFGRYKQVFDKYYDQLQKMSGHWKAAGKEQDQVAKHFEKMASAMTKQVESERQEVEVDKRRTDTVERQEHLWTSISRSGTSFAKNITHATESMLRWTGILGAVGGLLGAGGLWGIDRMARGTAEDRRSSSGLGLSIGQQKAWQQNLGRIVDSDAFLGWINSMEMDVTKQGPVYGLQGRGLSGNTSSDALSLLDTIRAKGQTMPFNQLRTQLNAYGLQMDDESLRRLVNTPNAEYQQLRSGTLNDSKGLNIGDKTAKAWQDFTQQMEKAGTRIHNLFTVGLLPLEEPLRKLSDAFIHFAEMLIKSELAKDAIEGLGKGLDRLGKFLTSPEFEQDIEKFSAKVKELVESTGGLVQWLTHPGDAAKAAAGTALAPLMDSPGTRWWAQHMTNVNTLEGANKVMALTDLSAGLPAGFLEAVKMQESGTSLHPADSSAGAMGIMQLLAGTARTYGVGDPRNDIRGSILASGDYFAALSKQYRGDLTMALAAYNWGPGNLDKDLAANKADWFKHLPSTTQKYVTDVAHRIEIMNNTGGSATVSVNQLAH